MTTGNKALTLPVIHKVIYFFLVQSDRRENINEQRSRAVSKLKTVRDSGNFPNNSPANFAFTPIKNPGVKSISAVQKPKHRE